MASNTPLANLLPKTRETLGGGSLNQFLSEMAKCELFVDCFSCSALSIATSLVVIVGLIYYLFIAVLLLFVGVSLETCASRASCER